MCKYYSICWKPYLDLYHGGLRCRRRRRRTRPPPPPPSLTNVDTAAAAFSAIKTNLTLSDELRRCSFLQLRQTLSRLFAAHTCTQGLNEEDDRGGGGGLSEEEEELGLMASVAVATREAPNQGRVSEEGLDGRRRRRRRR